MEKETITRAILKTIELPKGEKIFDKTLLPSTVKNIGLMYGTFLGAKYSYASLRFLLSQAERKCGAYEFSEGKKGCIAREKIKIYGQQLKYLEENRKKCKDKECLNKVDSLTREAKIQMIMAKKDLQEYKEYLSSLQKPKELEESKVLQELDPISVAKGVGAFAAQGLVWGLVDSTMTGAWRKAELLWNVAARKCEPYGATGPMRDMCISKYKLQALTQKRDILKRSLMKCQASSGREKCEMKIQTKINEIEGQIRIFNDNIKIYKQGAIEATKEEAAAKR